MLNILFVCMGNICRSPMAEGAFRQAVHEAGLDDQFIIDSAGTIGFHAGSAPDRRAQETTRKRGVDISRQKSRPVVPQDYEEFDYILAMDRDNLEHLIDCCPPEHQHKISLFLTHAPGMPLDEMPDPYYGHSDQFESCYLAAMDAAEGLLAKLKEKHF